MMLKNYHDRVDATVCLDSSSFCHLGECTSTANLKDNTEKAFDEHSINDVRFKI